ncbi:MULTISPECIES: NmrA family NAD(P)-binding protein [Micromonospora]|uniref:NmrA family NAD(P)-binding protein n=1 Tax=Micromonospora TaxID=1873 RepID=UPI000D6F16D9|nr:NAD(P)H-binding protein [Micromonospora sp. S4605]PWU58006.1 hydroxylase [Micromonospora sp. S4605]
MTYLVTGATGRAGRHVVSELLARGVPVRALTRDPARATGLPAGVEVVAGDLTDPATLPAAFEGVVGVHLLTAAGDDYATLRTGPEIVALAERAGVRRLAVLWNGKAGPVEEAVRAGRLEWTMLQPVDFMSNTLHWAESIRAAGEVREPFADVRSAVVDEADVGAVAAEVLTGDGHAGQAYTLTGPQALTPRQRLATVAAATGRELRFVELTEEQARARWRQAGYDEELIDLLASWQGDPPPVAYTVTDTVQRLLGRPPRTFADWARAHADAFR